MNKTNQKLILSSLVATAIGLASVSHANDDRRSREQGIERSANQSAERSAGQAVDDATVTAAVKAKLLEDDLTEGFDINVDTRNGHVTLRGGADSAAARSAATRIAMDTDGVRSVDNQITVAAEGSVRRERANEATASGQVRRDASQAGNEISDAWLTSKVKAQLLADNDVNGMDINVETSGRVVSLIGQVPTAAAKAEAVRIAQATEGVSRVDASRLVVGTEARR